MTILNSPASRRYKDWHFKYDSDTQRQFIFAQRVYAIPGQKNFPDIWIDPSIKSTPLTTLFFSRTQTNEGVKPRVKPFEGRHVIAYYKHDNEQGFIQRKAFIPFKPTDENFTNHLREILNFGGLEGGIQCFDYFGETHNNTGIILRNKTN